MNEVIKGIGAGVISGGIITALAWEFARPEFFLLSALGTIWIAGVTAIYLQREYNLLFSRAEPMRHGLTAVFIYSLLAIPASFSTSTDRSMILAAIVIGIFTLGVGIGSMATEEALNSK